MDLRNRMFGKNNPMWINGNSYEPYTSEFNKKLKEQIRERDSYTCQICNKYGNIVHHKDYDKKNCNPNNLITLCRKCHIKTNFNRERWIQYFNNLLTLKLCQQQQ